MGITCFRHPDKPATHTDAFVDTEASGQHTISYIRRPICEQCAALRKTMNTARIEPLEAKA